MYNIKLRTKNVPTYRSGLQSKKDCYVKEGGEAERANEIKRVD